MRPFILEQAATANAAVQAASVANVQFGGDLAARYLAGGTTLIDLMKLDVMRPDLVIDINALGEGALGRIEADRNGLRLGGRTRSTTRPASASGNCRSGSRTCSMHRA